MNLRRPNEQFTSPQMTQIDADFRRPSEAAEPNTVRSFTDTSNLLNDFDKHGNILRKSASSANHSPPIRPREIEVHIEELVLHGFAPSDRWRIAEALEEQLHGLLAAKGIPPAWLSSPERIDAGAINAAGLAKPTTVGAEIAGSVYRGGAK